MSVDCIFCKIVAGEVPSCKVYEDGDVLAFMDIAPVAKGHALVIPKQHCNPLMDTPVDVLQKIIVAVQKVARAQTKGLGAIGINVTQANGKTAGQIVPHVHFHVIPRSEDCMNKAAWVPGKYASSREMEEFAARIRKALE